MKLFKIIFTIFIFAKSCFGGTSSICGPIVSNFASLSQTSEIILDEGLSFFNRLITEFPVTANGCAYSMTCKINQLQSIISDEAGRLAGADATYVSEILNGQVEPIFGEPLNCIQDGLISLRDKIKFMKSVGVENITNSFVPANVPPNAPCSDLQLNVITSFNAQTTMLRQEILNFIDLISSLASKNKADLLKKILIALKVCETEGEAIAIADLVGGSHTEVVAYVNGSRSQLSYPLDCVQDIIDEHTSGTVAGYTKIISTII